MKKNGVTQTSKEIQARGPKMMERLRAMMADIPKPEFVPLKSWPARPHFRQAEINQLRLAPSFDVERHEREKERGARAPKKPTLWV